MSHTFSSIFVGCLLGIAAAGCSTDVPQGDTGSAGSAGGTGVKSGSVAAYDPARDPLVNPDSLFMSAPDDATLIDSDAILYRTLDGNPANLNPLFMTSTYEFFMDALMFKPLFTFAADMKWAMNDSLVESFAESEDRMTYTVKLRKGLTWHDGHPLTAHDVVFSYENIMDDRVPCPSQKTGTDQLAGVEAIDDHTVIYRHKAALPTNKWNAYFSIIPKHIYEVDKAANPDLKSGSHNNKYNRAPIGNGPYKFVRWDEKDRIILERWEDFPGAKPHFKQVVFRIIEDSNIGLITFEKGDTDELRLTAKQFATQTLVGSDFAERGFKVRSPKWIYWYICWNMNGSNPFFADKRVRRALSHATDVDRILRDLTYNLHDPCNGIFHPDSPQFDASIQRIPFDLDKAGKLLDEAGWKIDPARGGWRYKDIDGKPTKFEFTLLIPQQAELSVNMGAMLQGDLKSIGVDMKTVLREWATLSQNVRMHEFEATTAAWGTGTDPDSLWNIWHSESYTPDGSGRNYGGFVNDRVDELFELARHEFDEAKRWEYYREISRIIYEEQPYTFLTTRTSLWGVANKIHGVTTSPRGLFNFEPAERAWWVDALKQ